VGRATPTASSSRTTTTREFRYDRDPVGVLQGLAPERVFTIGTVSKSLAPTIRVGWVLARPRSPTALAEEKLLADRGTPGSDQRRSPCS
jgi:GntR family transcriptional regulator/MocR family aminotransferase